MGDGTTFTATTVGELKRILEPFSDEAPINGVGVEYTYSRGYGGKLMISLLTERERQYDG